MEPESTSPAPMEGEGRGDGKRGWGAFLVALCVAILLLLLSLRLDFGWRPVLQALEEHHQPRIMQTMAQAQMNTISVALLAYWHDHRELPDELTHVVQPPPNAGRTRAMTSAEGLLDPWGQPYHYHAPARDGRHPYDLYSSGPDLTEATADDIHVAQRVEIPAGE